MASGAHSPRITHVSWGQLRVAGTAALYKDAKLFPGGSRRWDWRETGTRHIPGIQPADVTDLLERGARVVVLGCGFDQRLQVCPETLQLLEDKGVPVEVLPTEEAVQRYNGLCETQLVGALIHSTC